MEKEKITIKKIWKINQDEKILSTKSWYSRKTRFVCIPITKFFLNFNPNFLTLLSIISCLISIPFFFMGGYKNILIGILFTQLYEIIDTIDGNVARTMKKTSLRGAYLDYIPNIVCFPLVFVSLGWGLFNSTSDLTFILIGIIAGFSFLAIEPARLFKYSMFNELKTKKRPNSKPLISRSAYLKFDFIFNFPSIWIFLIILSVLNLTKYFLIFYATTLPLILVARVYYEYLSWKKTDKKWEKE